MGTTIDQAIIRINLVASLRDLKEQAEFQEALKLGIEALKRVKVERTGYESYAPDLLPGETGE